MFIFVALILLALALSGLTYSLAGWYSLWYMFWTIPLFAGIYYLALFASFIIALYLFSLLIAKDKDRIYPPSRPTMWIISETAFLILRFLRVSPKISGLGKLPPRGTPIVIVHNHLSMFDEFVLLTCLPRPLVFISKPSNLRIPIAGAYMRKAGYLPIVQDDLVNGAQIIAKGQDLLRKGVNVCIAPEGTRNKDFPEKMMLPFHPGSFRLATEVKAHIVLFAIQNTNNIASRFPGKTKVYCDCVGVITPEEYENLSSKELAIHCQNLIFQRLENKKARSYHLKKKKED